MGVQSDKTSQYDKKGHSVQQDKSIWQKSQYDKKVNMTKIHHYDSTLLFAQHNNTFSKSLNLSLIAKNKRLLLVIASRLNGKAKHEKAHLKMIFEFPYSTESVLKSLKTREVIIRHKS